MLKIILLFEIVFILTINQAVSELDHLKNFVLSNNDFALRLQKSFDSDGNSLILPVNVLTALVMFNNVVEGSNIQKIRQLMGYNDSNPFFANLKGFLKNTDDHTLKVINAIATRNGLMSDEVQDNLITYYDILSEGDGFVDKYSISGINERVQKITDGKINNFLNEFDRSARKILLSAVYFKGSWSMPFRKLNTRQVTFYNNGINRVNVQMMYSQNKFFYKRFSDIGLQAILLPYEGNELNMLVLLPLARDGLKNLEKGLTVSQLDYITSNLKETRIIVNLPKFKLEDTRYLKENLKSLGFKDIFNQNGTDVSEDTDFFLTDVKQKTVIEISEEGTEINKRTGKWYTVRGRRLVFHVDHPFLFVIRDNDSGLILFIGRANEL